MNKAILGVCLLALGLSGVNTFLLLEMVGKFKELGDKVEPIAKKVEQIQTVLQKLPLPHAGAEPGSGPRPPAPGRPDDERDGDREENSSRPPRPGPPLPKPPARRP